MSARETVLTRALLEKYLRAKGWEYHREDVKSLGHAWRLGETWFSLGLMLDAFASPEYNSLDTILTRIGLAEQRAARDVAAALGMCAAATDLIAKADSYTARTLLTRAGVNPDRWLSEAAPDLGGSNQGPQAGDADLAEPGVNVTVEVNGKNCRCNVCGDNIFKRHVINRILYRCCGCGARYRGV